MGQLTVTTPCGEPSPRVAQHRHKRNNFISLEQTSYVACYQGTFGMMSVMHLVMGLPSKSKVVNAGWEDLVSSETPCNVGLC